MGTTDPRERFTAAADDYARYRPGYPALLPRLTAIYARLEANDRIVDVGCGTGISTRLFAAAGYSVVGIDPNEAMLAKARAAGGAEYQLGEAAATGLPDRSFKAVIAAQALHWFDMDAVVPEWHRILRPGGACAAFWNYRVREGWQADYERLLVEHSTDYAAIALARDDGNDGGQWVRRSNRCVDVEEHSVPNAQTLDWQALLGRVNSSSYVIHGVADRPAFEAALRRLFDASQTDGVITFRYRSYLLLWAIRD